MSDTMALFVALAALLIIGVILGLFIRASFSFAPWVPSKLDLLDRALSKWRHDEDKHFVDLGSGDGRAVFLAAKKYQLIATGYEISPLPYAISKIRQLAHIKRHINLRFKNLYSADLSRYDIIYVYGLPLKLNQQLLPKLRKEVRPGTLILSYNFSIKSQKPIEIMRHKWRRLMVYRWENN